MLLMRHKWRQWLSWSGSLHLPISITSLWWNVLTDKLATWHCLSVWSHHLSIKGGWCRDNTFISVLLLWSNPSRDVVCGKMLLWKCINLIPLSLLLLRFNCMWNRLNLRLMIFAFLNKGLNLNFHRRLHVIIGSIRSWALLYVRLLGWNISIGCFLLSRSPILDLI